MKTNRRVILKNFTTGFIFFSIHRTTFLYANEKNLNERFIHISEYLTGQKVDEQLANKYLKIILSENPKNEYYINDIYDNINKKLHKKDPNLNKLEKEIITYWYSGISKNNVINYFSALSWKALSFAKPQGTCGGVFGYWSKNP